MNPKVTFLVPCYNFAEFLPECINSILGQTYRDFELLILDDCSQDDTPEVAKKFKDPRVKYIRNETNLGHLRNYNKGIGLARGQYVWLISADDLLRKPYVLERYISSLEKHPDVGYIFCAAMGLEGGVESSEPYYTSLGEQDRIFSGRRFLIDKLLRTGCIVAPSVMVRKECYEKGSLFPLDMPHQGDLYLWGLFALRYRVAYLGEPMVSYRRHDSSMEKTLKRKDPGILFADNVAVLWRLKQEGIKAGAREVVSVCRDRLAEFYAFRLLAGKFDLSTYGITDQQYEESLLCNATDLKELKKIRARVQVRFADGCYARKSFSDALASYKAGLRQDAWMPKAWIKYILLCSGRAGIFFREALHGRQSALMRKGPSL